MPITKYKCPSGRIIDCQECIDGCPDSFRCVPPGLVGSVYKNQRKWKGKLSVTQVLNPTTQNWLSITKDLTVSPQQFVYMMIGTINHAKFEDGSDGMKGIESEVFIETDYLYGTTDLLENKNSKYFLRDIKNKKCSQAYFLLDYDTVGDRKVAFPSWKQQGIKIKKSEDVAFQLNTYRMMLEETRGITIDSMYMDCVFIDWSPLSSPTKYGLKHQTYSVPIPYIENNELNSIINKAKNDLDEAISNDVKDLRPCYEYDNWKEFGKDGSGNRCKYYCQCTSACKEMFGDEHKYI